MAQSLTHLLKLTLCLLVLSFELQQLNVTHFNLVCEGLTRTMMEREANITARLPSGCPLFVLCIGEYAPTLLQQSLQSLVLGLHKSDLVFLLELA